MNYREYHTPVSATDTQELLGMKCPVLLTKLRQQALSEIYFFSNHALQTCKALILIVFSGQTDYYQHLVKKNPSKLYFVIG